jgi:hypothetical protein
VVIGNTATMGEGMNLQKGTTDIHHLDMPWEPASMQQRNGRGLRQGNLNEAVRIHTYLPRARSTATATRPWPPRRTGRTCCGTAATASRTWRARARSRLDDMRIMLVLVHPETGAVLTAGAALDFGTDGKMVVTGVNMRAGTVTMRRYADTAGARPVTVPLKETSDARPFELDAQAEADEVRAKFEEQAAAKLDNLTNWDEVKNMPSAVLEANHDLIQRQIKEGAKAYKFHIPYGSVPMVDRATGDLKMAESYEHTKLHDTHDYLLPTDAAKDKVVQAWMDARRSARIGTEMVKRSRGAGSRSGAYDHVPRRQYKDARYDAKGTNPFKHLLGQMSGQSVGYGVKSALEKEAMKRLEAEQVERIRRAPSANLAIEHLMPLATIGGGESDGMGGKTGGTARYPREALAMAWARARHLGQLDEPASPTGGHHDYAYGGDRNATVHNALSQMARASGHRDLVEAFAHTAERHGLSKKDVDNLRSMTGFGSSARTLQLVKKIATRLGIMDKRIGELADMRLGGSFAKRYSSGSGWGSNTWDAQNHNSKTFGAVLDELLAAQTAKEAA